MYEIGLPMYTVMYFNCARTRNISLLSNGMELQMSFHLLKHNFLQQVFSYSTERFHSNKILVFSNVIKNENEMSQIKLKKN